MIFFVFIQNRRCYRIYSIFDTFSNKVSNIVKYYFFNYYAQIENFSASYLKVEYKNQYHR